MSANYINPPLVEAICEVRFQPTSQWDITIPGRIYDLIKLDFPLKEQVIQYGINISLNNPTNAEAALDKIPLARFRNNSGNQLIQVGKDLVSINHLSPYTNWVEFAKRIDQGLNACKAILQSDDVQSVSLRYINQIEIQGDNFEPKDYFNLFPGVTNELPQDYLAYIVGIRVPVNHIGGILTLETSSILIDNERPGILLNISCYNATAPNNKISQLKDWIEHAHNEIERIFEATIRDKMRLQFNQEGNKNAFEH